MLRNVFALNSGGLNWPRAVLFIDAALIPLVVFFTIGYEQYLISALLGLLFSMLVDPGGTFAYRAWNIALFGAGGAALTALGYGIAGEAWGWLVFAASAVTLLAGLAVVFGARRFVSALLLNLWLVIALGIGFSLHHYTPIQDYTWAQVLAWAGGSALWIALAFVAWLVRGRRDEPRPISELPDDTTHRALGGPVIAFALIRALAIAGATALAFGLDLPHGLWIPIAAIVAMKPSLGQSTLVAAQRLTGALIGALVAALLLLIPTSQHGLRLLASVHAMEIVALILLMHGVAARFWNYTIYSSAIAAGVLILMDLPQPSDYGTEGYRVLWTLTGVGIGVIVMLLGGLLAKRSQAAHPPARPGARSA